MTNIVCYKFKWRKKGKITKGNFAALWWSREYLIKRQPEIKQDIGQKIAMLQKKKVCQENDVEQLRTELEIYKLKEKLTKINTPTLFYTGRHAHYSIEKIAKQLRMQLCEIQPNEDGTMNIACLEKLLIEHKQDNPFSPIIVNVTAGTTMTGAIDDIPAVYQTLKKICEEDLPYTIHMDAAFLGLVLPIIKPFGEISNYFADLGVRQCRHEIECDIIEEART